MEYDDKEKKKKESDRKVAIKEDITPQHENGDETNLFKKNQDNGGDSEHLKHQINNKINTRFLR